MQCYDCEHSMKVDLQIIRTGMHPSEAPKDIHSVRICLMYPDIFIKLVQNLPKNHEPNKVVGTSDYLIKHCTKYAQRPMRPGERTIQSEHLAHEIGNVHVSEGMTPHAQWERIYHLLHTNGFTIVRREVDS